MLETLNAAGTVRPQRPTSGLRAGRIAVSHSPSMHLLGSVLRLAGPEADLLRHAERPWASATFQGTRHTIALCFSGPDGLAAGEAFIAALPEHEFTIARQLVADATVSEVDHEVLPQPHLTVEVELLLLEDC